MKIFIMQLCGLIFCWQSVYAQTQEVYLWKNAEQFKSFCDEGLGNAQTALMHFKKLNDGNRLSVLTAYQQIFVSIDPLEGWSSLLYNIHEDEKIRDVAQECEQRVSKFKSDFYLDTQAYEVLQKSKDFEIQDEQAKRLYELLMRDFKRAGVHLSAEIRKRLSQINDEITLLSQEYAKNINQDRKTAEFSPKDLMGLPDDFIKAHTDPKTQKAVISTDYPDYFPVLQYAKKRDVRKKLYELFMQRAYPINQNLLEKVLKLRYEYAKILGYQNWAQYNAEDKMVKNDQNIDIFLNNLNKITSQSAEQEKKQLLTYLQKDDSSATVLEFWDRLYYGNLAQKELYQFDTQQIREYFEYSAVKNGLLELYAHLFGVEFIQIPASAWSNAVEVYEVKVSGKLIGKFFLDMHPRASKYKHAAVFPLQTGIKGGQIPIAALICNFPEPKKGTIAKMDHKEVVTFFHEFGHLIHHILAQQSSWLRLSGISVEWDFVEAPSQILEEWAYDVDVLKKFARNQKNEVIPTDLIKQLKAANDFGKALAVSVQLFYAAYSFYLHAQEPNFDLIAKNKELYAKYAPFPFHESNMFFANFGHLIGYSSGYYTYQWSLVIAKDLFSRFKKEGLLNRDTARDYAEKILAPGSTKSANDLVKDFLGREYSLDAYQQWLKQQPNQNDDRSPELKPNTPKLP